MVPELWLLFVNILRKYKIHKYTPLVLKNGEREWKKISIIFNMQHISSKVSLNFQTYLRIAMVASEVP